jgi:hypothetical protein
MPFPINTPDRLLLENGSYLLLEDNLSKVILDKPVLLDDPLTGGIVASATPGFTFSGENLNGGNINYQIQIDTANTFDSQGPTPAYVQSKSAVSTGSGQTPAATFTSTPTAGNLLVAVHSNNGTAAAIVITGWNQLTNAQAGSTSDLRQICMFWKISDGTETTVTMSGASGNGWQFTIAEYSGIASTSTLLVENSQTNASGATQATPTVTPTSGSAALLIFATNNSTAGTTWSTEQVNGSATGVTEREDAQNATTGGGHQLSDLVISSTSGTYQGVATSSTTDVGAGAIAIFRVNKFALIDKSSTVDVGFANNTTGLGDDKLLLENGSYLLLENASKIVLNRTFANGDSVTYTPQANLSSGTTYYWRVRSLTNTTTSTKLAFDQTTVWQVPDGVTSVVAEVWGGGGSGGGHGTGTGSGNGGGGGAYSKKTISVTPGSYLTASVGAGGAAPAGGNNPGNSGSDSWFIDAATVLAKGGAFGDYSGGVTAGGAGGVAASGIGDVTKSGGTGGAKATSVGGGGGGGSGGSTADGQTGQNGSTPWGQGGGGGTANGASGGNGGDVGTGATGNGSPGLAPGGGGGGSGSGTSTGSGGAGANGRVLLTYTVQNDIITTSSWSETRSVTVSANTKTISVSDSVTISEAVTVVRSILTINVSDSVTVSEALTVNPPAGGFSPNVNDSVTVSESLSIQLVSLIGKSESVTTADYGAHIHYTVANVIANYESHYEILYQGIQPTSTTYTELLNTTSPNFNTFRFIWNPSDWDNVTAIYFESSLGTTSTGNTGFAQLYDVTNSAVITGSEVSFTPSGATNKTSLQRTADIKANMPVTPTLMTIQAKVSSGTSRYDSARLVIQQSGGTTLKTVNSVLLNSGNNISSSTPTVDQWNNNWLYEPSQFDGVTSIHFEIGGGVFATGNVLTAQLWDLTSSAVVAAINTDGTTGINHVQSPDISNLLTSGHEYGLRFFTSTGAVGGWGGARLFIKQSNFTKTQNYYHPFGGGGNIATTNSAAPNFFDAVTFDPTQYGNTALTLYHDAVLSNGDATATITAILQQAFTGTVANSPVTSTAGSTLPGRYRASTPIATPTSAFTINNAGYLATGTTTSFENVSRLIVNMLVNPNVPTSDSITVSETLSRPAISYTPNVSDNVSVTETISVAILTNPQISLSDAVTVTETISVQESATLISVSDSVIATESSNVVIVDLVNKTEAVTVTETLAITVVDDVKPSDSITATETITMLVTGFINVSDSTTVSETLSAPALSYSINVSDSTTVSETITKLVLNNLSFSESVTASETVTMLAINNVSVSDSTTITETVSVTILSTIQASDAVTASESITLLIPTLFISTSDSVTTTESQQISVGLVTSDNVTVTETVSVIVPFYLASVSDNTTVTDSPNVNLVDNINLSDGTTASETLLRQLVSFVLVTDAVTTSETQTTPIVSYSISVSDNTTVTETIVLQGISFVSVSDSVTTADTVTSPIVSYLISVSDATTVTENTNVAQAYTASISDSVTVTESPALTKVLNISASDAVTASETAKAYFEANINTSDSVSATEFLFVSKGGLINVFDNATTSETTTVLVPFYIVSVSDSSTVTESISLTKVLNISVSDSSTITESIALLESVTISVSDSSAVTDSPSLTVVDLVNVSDNSTLTDSPTVNFSVYL